MKVTVFTPTYNRAHIIEQLYRSLQRQTCFDFEWLVVDDGSQDHTDTLFDGWRAEENSFPIRYFKKENGGKCSAVNYGLELAQGELFFTVDSDDYLTDDAIEKVIFWEAGLPKDKQYCGLAGNLGISPTETPNNLFDGPYLDGSALSRYRGIDGERAMVFYTEIHRRYLYPVFPNEKFMTEAVVWNRMAMDGYQIRFFNDIIWVYEYQTDGLTKAGRNLFLNNPKGYGLWLQEKARLESAPLSNILRMNYSYTADLSSQLSVREIAQNIGTSTILIFLLKVIHRLKSCFRK